MEHELPCKGKFTFEVLYDYACRARGVGWDIAGHPVASEARGWGSLWEHDPTRASRNGTRLSVWGMISVGIAHFLPPRSLPPWRSVHNQNAASVAPLATMWLVRMERCFQSVFTGTSHHGGELRGGVRTSFRGDLVVNIARRGQAPPWREIAPVTLNLVPFGASRGVIQRRICGGARAGCEHGSTQANRVVAYGTTPGNSTRDLYAFVRFAPSWQFRRLVLERSPTESLRLERN